MNKVDRAKIYLQDDFFLELLNAHKEVYKSYIFGSAEHDVEGRERALVKLRAIEEFEAFQARHPHSKRRLAFPHSHQSRAKLAPSLHSLTPSTLP